MFIEHSVSKLLQGFVFLSVQDVPDGDIGKQLQSGVLQAPSIVVFQSEEKVNGVYVVGDGVYSEMNNIGVGGVMGSVVVLLALYYIFDLGYPRPYSMFLALLQVFVAQEPYKGETSKGYKTFSKKLSTVVSKLPADNVSASV